MSQASFAKRQREKARQDKAAAKAAKRAERQEAEEPTPTEALTASEEEAILAGLAALHRRFDEGDMPFEEFEEAKAELMERLAG